MSPDLGLIFIYQFNYSHECLWTQFIFSLVVLSTMSSVLPSNNHSGTPFLPNLLPLKRTCNSTRLCPGPMNCGWVWCLRPRIPNRLPSPTETPSVCGLCRNPAMELVTCCRECLVLLCMSCSVTIPSFSGRHCPECAIDILCK